MRKIVQEVLPIIRSTREMLLPYYGKVEIAAEKDGSAHNIVTKLDYEVEKYLAEKFKQLDPSIAFAGEEFGGNRDVERLWLVDPIDGTLHFARGMPFCTTMVALIENGQVTFSAIYDFVNDIIYHAELGNGAYQNGERIAVSNRPVSSALVSFETKIAKPENAEMHTEMRKKLLLFSSLSAGYEFALVATGKLEGRICYDPYGKDYDFAPGSLLVSEAGGVVANIGSNSYDYRNVNLIASNKNLYDDLTKGDDALFPIVSDHIN